MVPARLLQKAAKSRTKSEKHNFEDARAQITRATDIRPEPRQISLQGQILREKTVGRAAEGDSHQIPRLGRQGTQGGNLPSPHSQTRSIEVRQY